MHTQIPDWSTGNFTGNRKRLCSHVWQRRLALICWLALALAVFLPAIFACLDSGSTISMSVDE